MQNTRRFFAAYRRHEPLHAKHAASSPLTEERDPFMQNTQRPSPLTEDTDPFMQNTPHPWPTCKTRSGPRSLKTRALAYKSPRLSPSARPMATPTHLAKRLHGHSLMRTRGIHLAASHELIDAPQKHAAYLLLQIHVLAAPLPHVYKRVREVRVQASNGRRVKARPVPCLPARLPASPPAHLFWSAEAAARLPSCIPACCLPWSACLGWLERQNELQS